MYINGTGGARALSSGTMEATDDMVASKESPILNSLKRIKTNLRSVHKLLQQQQLFVGGIGVHEVC